MVIGRGAAFAKLYLWPTILAVQVFCLCVPLTRKSLRMLPEAASGILNVFDLADDPAHVA